jgi:hypothetical integral membrane protein (TIGR02206 family)
VDPDEPNARGMPFHPFNNEHFGALLIGGLGVMAFLWAGRRGGNSRTLATALLAFLNLSAYPVSQVAWLSLGRPMALEHMLPLHLCDIAAVTAGFALLTQRPTLCSMTYFWGLAATFQALITPALGHGFPGWPFFAFFVHHFAIVAAALYLPIVLGWRPKQPLWRSPLEVYGWSCGYLVFALTVNAVLGTNYGFASRPPQNPSLIDYLGPWPWYLLSMQVIAICLFLLLAWPLRARPSQ